MSESLYYTLARNKKFVVVCTFCQEDILVRKYAQHLQNIHKKKITGVCIWCYNYTWKQRTTPSEEQYEHRYNCLLKRIDSAYPSEEIPSTSTNTAENLISLIEPECPIQITNLFLNCPQCDNFLQSPEYLSRHDVYQSEGVNSIHFGTHIPFNWSFIHRQIEYLNAQQLEDWHNISTLKPIEQLGFDIRLPFLFLNLKNTVWFHCCVRFYLWDDLYTHIHDNPDFCVLDNWCLCNAGYPEDITLRHRHIILIIQKANEGEFQKFMAKTNRDNKHKVTNSNFMSGKKRSRGRLCRKLVTAEHLLNTVRYVSYPKSNCKNSKLPSVSELQVIDCDSTMPTTHYFIHSPTLPHFKAIIMGTFQNSLQSIYNILSRNKVIANIHLKASLTDKTINCKYVFDIKQHTIPYANTLTRLNKLPTGIAEYNKTAAEKIIYLIGSKERKYFKMTAAVINPITSHETFNRLQWEGNGGLLNVFAEDTVHLSKTQVVTLYTVYQSTRILTGKVSYLEQQIVAQSKEISELKKDNKNKDLRTLMLEKENECNKKKILDLENAIKELKRKSCSCSNIPKKKEFLFEISLLKQENVQLKQDVLILRRENVDMKRRIEELEKNNTVKIFKKNK
ncbi:hypothetical protein SGHV124 [Glossina pallidipes salivary gland hypertrophy virus]|uniref:Uncharacterized protein n=1 Tax=Glossina hytrovirus (isolate Glossina pallidipes/Ethiopia/Seibersdorf/-) TaxID=379529 RepID=B0YLS8_GHVS|nr:hypothetical protein SGHV124 [Glossina pallidipes salivary gland hypertrophy virus]ABQ08897.1 hypothetical protein SGHV124 [Glossina pallidipes salivary gland hypertrophy virus]